VAEGSGLAVAVGGEPSVAEATGTPLLITAGAGLQAYRVIETKNKTMTNLRWLFI
jgi:hypothetical protein